MNANEGQRLLRALDVTLTELARRVGVDRKAARKWRDGLTTPSDEHQAKLEREFRIPRETWKQAPTVLEPALPPAELSLTERLAGARLEVRRLARQADAALKAQSERDTLAAELEPLRAVLLPRLARWEAVHDAAAVALAPPVQNVLTGLREAAAAIGEALAELAAQALAQRRLLAADKADVTRERVLRLLRKMAPADRASLLKTASWRAIVARLAQVLRDAPEALAASREALADGADPFVRALAGELAEVRHIVWPCSRYERDVQAFCREILGFELYERQLEVVGLLHDHDQVAVASGHRVGKSRLVAAIALWWFSSFEGGRVLLVAPTDRQLQHIVWRELRLLVGKSGRCLACLRDDPNGPRPCVHSQRIQGTLSDRATGGLMSDDGRQVIGFTSQSTEAAAGFASARVLVLADEASGVRDEIFDALAGNRAGAGSKLLMTGNPTKLSGRFYEAFFKRKDAYASIRIASTDTPNYLTGENLIPGLASREFVERTKLEYGEDSAFYKVRVLGQHAIDDADKLFPAQVILEAQDRWEDTPSKGQLTIGVDCAGGTEGGDFSAFAVRRGQKILALESIKLRTEQDHLTHVLELVNKYEPTVNPVRVVVDADGAIGTRVAAHLEGANLRRLEVARFLGHLKNEARTNQYFSRRDECIAHASKWLKSGGAIPPDFELEEELNLFRLEQIDVMGFGKTRATSKKEIRRALGRSSDKADALCMAVWEQPGLKAHDLEDVPDHRPITPYDGADFWEKKTREISPYEGLDAWRR